MDDALEKFLRMLATASKSNAYSCQTIGRCTELHPIQKLTQEDLDAFNTVFSNAKLNAELVNKLKNDVFQKFAGDYSMDEIFKSSVRTNGLS